MTCPHCKTRFDAQESRRCPACGEPVPAVKPGLVKTSTILISTDSTAQVYRSLEDVPQPLRKRLVESTSGSNSATILIADRRGREELVRAVRRMPPGVQRGLVQSLFGAGEPAGRSGGKLLRAAAAVLVLLVLLAIAFLFYSPSIPARNVLRYTPTQQAPSEGRTAAATPTGPPGDRDGSRDGATASSR